MLSFLNSTVLLAAAAALIPLIIHLFSRRRVKVVEFSSLKHLKAMQRRQVRRLRLRQWLLLLLRMLIILAIVVAFARPTMKEGGLGSHAAVSAVVVLDNTASMGRYAADGELFELARKRVNELLDSFGESDKVAILTTSSTRNSNRRAEFTSAAVARELLGTVNVAATSQGLEKSLGQAFQMLANSKELNKELYIVSDRQQHALPETTLPGLTGLRVGIFDLDLDNNDNCALTDIDFGGQLVLPGHDFELTATIRNFGNRDRDDVIASLFLDGNRVAQVEVAIGADQEASAHFNRSVTRTGFHSGWVELSDDILAADNRRYFSFHIPERFNLLVIEGDPSAEYISLALSPSLGINQHWSVKTVGAAELSGISFWDYDVVIVAGSPRLADTYFHRLRAFVESGRALMLTYGSQTDTAFFNQHWSSISGVTIERPVSGNVTRAGYYTIASAQMDHPIFAVHDFATGQPPEIKFYGLPQIALQDEVQTLMGFSGDRPALTEYEHGRGRVLALLGPIEPAYSDLAGHAFFVPLISRSVEYLTAELSTFDLDLETGDQLLRSINLPGSVEMPLLMQAPDSLEYHIVVNSDGASLSYRPSPTEQTGIYVTSYLGREVDRFGLNLPTREGNLAAVDPDQLAAAMGVEEYHVIEREAHLASVISELRFGRELWHIFVWLAGLFLAAEMLVARSSPMED